MSWKRNGGELLWKGSVSRYFSKMKIYPCHFSETQMTTMCCQNLAVLTSNKTPFLSETVLLLFSGAWVWAGGEYGGCGRRCENELCANFRRVRQQMLQNRSVWQLLGVHSKSEHLSYEKGWRVQPKSSQIRWKVHQRFDFKITWWLGSNGTGKQFQ